MSADFKQKKVISIGVVSELTNLSLRQIRYYETRGLLFPERSNGGTRKYSFEDVEKLISISEQLEHGDSTFNMKQNEKLKERDWNKKGSLIKEQVHAFYNKPYASSEKKTEK